MPIEIKVPQVGESITEGVLVEWLAAEGASVEVDTPLFELETDKISLTVAAEHAGVLHQLATAGATVAIGQVVGSLEAEAGALGHPVAASEAGPVVTAGPSPEALDELAPSVRRLVSQHGLDPAAVKGTGPRGRLTKEDVLKHLEAKAAPASPGPERTEAAPTVSAPAPTQPAASIPARASAAVASPTVAPSSDGAPRSLRETRTPMSSLRRRLAQRLVQVQHEAAILTTFNEVDMTEVQILRNQYKAPFEAKYGIRLGFMSFFVKAVVEALRAVPRVNARIDGDDIVQAHYHDIGVAVSTPQGLVVPVIRDADRLSFAEIEARLAELARKARDRKLTLDELTGGTFSISNGGVYGSLLSTPILNPPQSAILGMHGIKKRPVVVDNDRIEARPMMYLALSYDHRLVDGAEAVTFLRRIVECIEAPVRLMLEV